MLTAFGATNRGLVREINEDALRADFDHGVFIVADGMGGHRAGEVASAIAVDTIAGFFAKTHDDDEFTWPFGVDPRLTYNGNRLLTAVRLANRRVFKESEGRSEYTGMGTTIVAAVIDGNRMSYAAVGDSRIYSFAADRLAQLTRDDTWVRALGDEGLDEAALAAHPMRHVLTNVVGARERTDVQLMERELEHDERIVLCTDGVHDALPRDAIASILRDCRNVQAAATRLVEEALARDGKDNITALVLQYCAGPDGEAAGAAGRSAP